MYRFLDRLPSRNKETGKFEKSEGKTQKMLEREKELGVVFEKDYEDMYKSKKLTQEKFAERWGVTRTAIFDKTEKKGGRLSWFQRVFN